MSLDRRLTFHFTAITFHRTPSPMTYGGVGRARWPPRVYSVCFRVLWTLSSPSNPIKRFWRQRKPVACSSGGRCAWATVKGDTGGSSLTGRDKHGRGEKHTSPVGLNMRSQRESLGLSGISKAYQSLLPGTATANTPESSNSDVNAISAPKVTKSRTRAQHLAFWRWQIYHDVKRSTSKWINERSRCFSMMVFVCSPCTYNTKHIWHILKESEQNHSSLRRQK